METTNRRGASASIAGGVILLLLGIIFLLQQAFNFPIWSLYWPFYVIIPGLLCLGLTALGGQEASWFAVPGAIVTTVGTILLAQDLTNRYETWAYAWALVSPFAVGVGLLLSGLRNGRTELIESGRAMAVTGLVLFLIFGAFFELLIFEQRVAAGVVWPLVLVALGVVLLFNRGRWPARYQG
jgi:hypothetical protein